MQPCYVPFLQVEPNTKLFPAVFVLPSSQNMIQFELGKLKVSHRTSQSVPILKVETTHYDLCYVTAFLYLSC